MLNLIKVFTCTMVLFLANPCHSKTWEFQKPNAVTFKAISTTFFDIKSTPSPLLGKLTEKEGRVSGDLKVDFSLYKDTELSMRTDHMQNKYMESAKHKYIELKLNPWKPTLKWSEFSGKLKVKGKTNLVTGKAMVKDGMLFAEFKVNVKNYPIGNIRYAGIGIKDEVEVSVKSKYIAK